MKYTVYEGSRRGGRPANEDRVGYAYTNESLVMVLADGMGGHSRGDLAAEILVREVLKMFRDLARPDLPNCQEFLLDAVYAAHATINEHALHQRMKDPPRTTCVVCVVQDGLAWWAHVGDSRLYHFSQGQLSQRTIDHSAVQQLVDSGLLAEDQMSTHPDRNKLLNGLGGYILPNIELSQAVQLAQGDVLLLCSDGLSDLVSSAAIRAGVERYAPDFDAAARAMIDAANRAGGNGPLATIRPPCSRAELIRLNRRIWFSASSVSTSSTARAARGGSGKAPASRGAATARAQARNRWLLPTPASPQR